jgi:hypothetical protein
MTSRHLVATLCAGLLGVALFTTASAHQPHFEDNDFTATAPGVVEDPTVSTAIYATLDNSKDVDYVTFQGKRGQVVLIGLTIPVIPGQENFTPAYALIGPGLPAAALPKIILAAPKTGAVIERATTGAATKFHEPFSQTDYWERQQKRFTLPDDGQYTIAVWDENGDPGRYTLVVGDREVFGGDMAFPTKLKTYWTPVPLSSTPQPQAPVDNHGRKAHCHAH